MAARIHQARLHKSAMPGIQPMTLVSNHHFPRHSHDHFGIGVLTFGAHRSWSGVGAVSASAGDVIMVNPGEMHDGAPLDENGRGWRMIYLDPAVLSREIEEELPGPIEMVRPVARDPLLAWHFGRLFGSLTDEQSHPLSWEENLLRALMCLLRNHGMAKPSSGRKSPHVTAAVQRLDSAPNSQVSLAELAALSGVSRFQLLRGFAKEVGITPHAYLMQRRILLVQRLLASGQTPAQAALHAGFADQSHMTRAFVRQLGVTPRHYRNFVQDSVRPAVR